jgi:hypothetical protein
MSSPYAIMRLPISRVALMLLAVGCIGFDATVPAIAQDVATYLVAATPHQPDSEKWHAGSIYRIGADQHLVQVNHLFSPAEHLTDVVGDLHGHLFLTGDHGIYIVHEDDPRRLDFVALETFDTFPCFGGFAEPSGKTGIYYCVGGNIYGVMARSHFTASSVCNRITTRPTSHCAHRECCITSDVKGTCITLSTFTLDPHRNLESQLD